MSSVNNAEDTLNEISPRTTQSYMVSVTPVKQAKSNWCWAACAEMAGKQFNPKSTKSQTDVVRKFYGNSLPNQLGSLGDVCCGATYVGSDGSEVDGIYVLYDPMSFQALCYSLQHNEAVIGVFDNSKTGVMHAMVLYGTQFIDDASGSQQKVNFINPSDGLRYTYKYSDLRSGAYNNLVYVYSSSPNYPREY